MRRLAGALLGAVALAACGVKAPPRPPAEARRAAGTAARGSETGTGAEAAPANDCGPKAATEQGTQR